MRKRSYLACIKNNEILLIREVGDEAYHLPGGRAEGNESAEECLVREIREEINVNLNSGSLEEIAKMIQPATDGGEDWETYIFKGDINDPIKVDGKEIAQHMWYKINSQLPLRTHLENEVMPLLKNGGYLK